MTERVSSKTFQKSVPVLKIGSARNRFRIWKPGPKLALIKQLTTAQDWNHINIVYCEGGASLYWKTTNTFKGVLWFFQKPVLGNNSKNRSLVSVLRTGSGYRFQELVQGTTLVTGPRYF